MADAPPLDAAAQAAAAAAAAASANQPFHADWVKPDGTLNSAVYDRLPEDVRYMKDTLGKYKTAEELVRGVANIQTFAGKKGLIPLPDNAPPELRAERKAVLDSVNGVPKEAKDYGIARPADLPEAQWDQGMADNFVKWAHENSVSPAAAKKLIALQIDTIKTQSAAQAAYETKFFEDQAKAFGESVRATNMPLDRANQLAERGAAELGLDLNKPEHQLLMKNADVRLMAMRHAMAVGEDTFVKGQEGAGADNDPMALAQDATHNKANPLYEPLHNQSHPQHSMAKAKLDGWWRAAAAKSKKAV